MSTSNTFPDRTQFRHVVAQVAERAKAKLPEAVNGRLESAVKLVLAGDVFFHDDGTVEVGSFEDPGLTYTLEGDTCTCQDWHYGQAPDGYCKHRIAMFIAKRVQQQLPAPVPEPSSSIDPRYLTTISGRPFVRFDGLLALAHERGLVELSTTVVSVTPDFAVCQAVARFQDGLVVTDIGDATPQNVKKHLAPHFVRLAATRASARALRHGLNISEVAVEELGSDDE
jgi:hypothetical protein